MAPRQTLGLKDILKVLRYTHAARASADTIKAYFIRWRELQTPPVPVCCDNDICPFHSGPLEWNGTQLKPILDHRNGVNSDNRPVNLRFLCPNCDSQLPTRGGANRGRFKKYPVGFATVRNDGKHDYQMFPEPAVVKITGSEMTMLVTRLTNEDLGNAKKPSG